MCTVTHVAVSLVRLGMGHNIASTGAMLTQRLLEETFSWRQWIVPSFHAVTRMLLLGSHMTIAIDLLNTPLNFVALPVSQCTV